MSTFLGDITAPKISCVKVIGQYFETQPATLNFKVSTNTNVMSLTSSLIRLYYPVQIDQGCKIQNNLSIGSYSPSNPNLWVETSSIQNGNIYASNNITAGVNIYATGGLINCKTLKASTTSSFLGDIKLSGTIKTHREDETLLFQQTKYTF